jgi:predicted TIM-barrel fold metal-dependent hydrolase
MLIADAQVHLWQRVVPGGKPQRPEPFGAAELLGLMDAVGIDRALLAPTSWSADGADGNDVVLAAAAARPDRFRAVGVLPLADPASPARLAAWRDRGVLGFCVRFHHAHLAPLLTDGTADWVWPAAERAGVPLTVNAPGQLARIGEIARRHPGLKLAIDHLGLGHGARIAEDVDALVALAACDNVAVKADGVGSRLHEGVAFDELQAQVCRALEAFGPRRVFGGSDLTRTWRPGCALETNYRELVELFSERLACLSGADRELVMGRALCDWFDW